MDKVHEIAGKVSNWGRWGADDEIGTLNLVTREVLRRAAACVKRGVVFSLGLPLDANGPMTGMGGRVNPIHLMSMIDVGLDARPDSIRFADDYITMPLQCATQWDSLAHAWYGGKLYNGRPAATITAFGAAKNGIDKLARRGVVSRGVLLDVARGRGVDRLASGEVVRPADLEAAEAAERVRVESGDVLLVRTGWLSVFRVDGDRDRYRMAGPGLGIDCVEWLHAREVAAVATDTYMVEIYPGEDPAVVLPLHMLCIRDMGLTLGEMFALDELAADCAADGTWDFLFTAPPLPVTGGVGSPINPLAVK
jgi:kynurenine formamidase